MLLHAVHGPIFLNWLSSQSGASAPELLSILRCVNRWWRDEMGRALALGRLWVDLEGFVGGQWGSLRLLGWESVDRREMRLSTAQAVLQIRRRVTDRCFVAVEARWLGCAKYDVESDWQMLSGVLSLRRVGIVFDTLALDRAVAADGIWTTDHCMRDMACENKICVLVRKQWARSPAGVRLWDYLAAAMHSTSVLTGAKQVTQIDWPAYYRSHDWQQDVDAIHVLACMWEQMIGQTMFGHLFCAFLVHSIVPFVGVPAGSAMGCRMRDRLQQEACVLPLEVVPLVDAADPRYYESLISNGVKGVGFPWASAALRVCMLRRTLAAELEEESAAATGDRHDYLRTMGFPLHSGELPTSVLYVERGQGMHVSEFSFEGGVLQRRSWRDPVGAELLAGGPRLRRVVGLEVFESQGVP